jgi:hypothetical protein
MTTYTVRFEAEINAATPLRAATIARDMMMDPDSKISVDVFPMEYVEEAEDYFMTDRHGWYAWFDGSVHPKDCFAWSIME